MHFLGRETELAKIKKALSHGKNLVVTGKYGMGRTSLIRRFSLLNQTAWRFLFADFSAPPSKVCHRLLSELQPKTSSTRRVRDPGYRQSRTLVMDLASRQERQCVLVLDNIGKLTHQKMEFIRFLVSDHRVLLIAIAERFLPEDDLFRLRASLYPSELIRLGHLSADQTAKFFRHAASRLDLPWTESDLHTLTLATRGYPLAMRGFVAREHKRKKSTEVLPLDLLQHPI